MNPAGGRWFLAVALSLLGSFDPLHAQPEGVRPCGELAALTIADVAITSATEVPPGSFTPAEQSRPLTVATAFCRVAALATPTPDSQIKIEVWIPAGAAWNGKLLGVGNGGFSGALPYPAMAAGLAKGYATVGTDTGHTGDQVKFGLGHPEKVTDWAHRSVHVMTGVAKTVVRSARGRFPDRAYFESCSTGGQQALSEAQRYPADYDGIVAGDPGHNRVRLILGFLWSWTATHDAEGASILPASKLSLLTTSAVAACDKDDGVADGLIGDPFSCRFDPASLACTGAETGTCLTERQIEAVRKVYDGARNPRTGEQIFPGWARGSEQGWGAYIVNPPEPVRVGFFRYFTFPDPAWHWRKFDWDRDVAFVESQMRDFSATSTDLRAFKVRGGKLIMYTGLADPVTPPQDTLTYDDGVAKAMGGLPATQEFFRFFPVPGMGHCGGGSGPAAFDALAALDQWVENGSAPAQLLGSHSSNGVVDRTRPLCAYPAVARHRGGSVDEASSFTCGAAASSTPTKGR